LSTKALLVVGTTIVAVVVALQFASRYELRARFDRLEALYASKAIGRTEALIRQNVESVRDLAADWAAWTDMWRYMDSGHAGFESSNLTEESLENLRMNYRVIMDATGRVIFTDAMGDHEFVAHPHSFEAELAASEAHRRGMRGEETSGIAVVDGVVVLYAAHPIVTTGGEGPVRGVLAFGRALTPTRVKELSRLTRHHIEVEPRVGAVEELGEAVRDLESMRYGEGAGTPGSMVYLKRRDEATLVASVVLKDTRGGDVGVLRAVQARGVMAEGEATILSLLTTFVAAGVLMGVVMLLAIEFGLVRRLRTIQRDIRAIDPMAPGARRVRVRGSDEVAAVAGALNTALAGVETAREKLRASEESFRAMSECSPIGVFMCDAEGNLVYCNAALRQLLGASMDQALGTGWVRRIHPEDRDEVARGWEACVRAGDPFHHEHRFVQDDGTEVWVQVNAAPVRRGRGIAGYVGTCDDITERMQQDEALRAAIDAAEGASQAKTNFLANMSHEIRTPMAAMLGFIELLDDPSVSSAGRADAVATIRRNGEQLLALINDILDVSKIEAGAMRIESSEFDLPRVLADVTALFRPLAEKKGIELNLEFATPLPSLVMGDATRVRQVISNLVANAVKFTNAGSVRVVASVDPGRVRLVHVRVADTGIGMSATVVSRLFKPFTQADASMTRRFGGTGLGLSISHQLSRMMGGDLKARSVEGVGSVFEATFEAAPVDGTNWLAKPVAVVSDGARGGENADDARREFDGAERVAAGVKRMAGPAAAGPLAGVHVMVVEDGIDNRRLAEHYLTRAGATVEMAEDGQEAMERLGEWRDRVDLVLMDIQMPRMDGYQATRALRQNGFGKPIVALTAHAMAEDRERCLATGCDAYMSKPLNRRELVALCARLVRGGAAEAA
jgi:PAS domain S-box-containing protein